MALFLLWFPVRASSKRQWVNSTPFTSHRDTWARRSVPLAAKRLLSFTVKVQLVNDPLLSMTWPA